MTWPFKSKHTRRVDVDKSEKALAEALSRKARSRRVAVGLERAIIQNHFTGDIETIMEGRR